MCIVYLQCTYLANLITNIAKLIIRLKCRFFTDGSNILSAGWYMYICSGYSVEEEDLQCNTVYVTFFFSFPLDLSNENDVHEAFPRKVFFSEC